MTEDELTYLTAAERAAWARCEAASAGPWQLGIANEDCPNDKGRKHWIYPPWQPGGICAVHSSQECEDTAFIIATRDALPAALAEIARLRAALTIIRDDCLDAVRESHMWRVATASALDIARDALTPPPASSPPQPDAPPPASDAQR